MNDFNLLQINTDSLSHKFTGEAYDWIVGFGPKIIIAIIIFFAGQWIIKILSKGLKKILSAKSFDATLRPFIQNLVQIILQVLLVLGLMQILGIQMTLFAAVLGAFGVAIGLALSGTLQNFASGVLIILLKTLRVGENIKTQGEEGTVVAIKLFYTVVRTYSNITVIVPNGKLSNEVIFNLSREKTRRIDVSIKFNHSIDFAAIKSIILKTISTFDKCLPDPQPKVTVEKIEHDGFTIMINAWINSNIYEEIKLELNERLLNDLKPFLNKV